MATTKEDTDISIEADIGRLKYAIAKKNEGINDRSLLGEKSVKELLALRLEIGTLQGTLRIISKSLEQDKDFKKAERKKCERQLRNCSRGLKFIINALDGEIDKQIASTTPDKPDIESRYTKLDHKIAYLRNFSSEDLRELDDAEFRKHRDRVADIIKDTDRWLDDAYGTEQYSSQHSSLSHDLHRLATKTYEVARERTFFAALRFNGEDLLTSSQIGLRKATSSKRDALSSFDAELKQRMEDRGAAIAQKGPLSKTGIIRLAFQNLAEEAINPSLLGFEIEALKGKEQEFDQEKLDRLTKPEPLQYAQGLFKDLRTEVSAFVMKVGIGGAGGALEGLLLGIAFPIVLTMKGVSFAADISHRFFGSISAFCLTFPDRWFSLDYWKQVSWPAKALAILAVPIALGAAVIGWGCKVIGEISKGVSYLFDFNRLCKQSPAVAGFLTVFVGVAIILAFTLASIATLGIPIVILGAAIGASVVGGILGKFIEYLKGRTDRKSHNQLKLSAQENNQLVRHAAQNPDFDVTKISRPVAEQLRRELDEPDPTKAKASPTAPAVTPNQPSQNANALNATTPVTAAPTPTATQPSASAPAPTPSTTVAASTSPAPAASTVAATSPEQPSKNANANNVSSSHSPTDAASKLLVLTADLTDVTQQKNSQAAAMSGSSPVIKLSSSPALAPSSQIAATSPPDNEKQKVAPPSSS